MKIIVYFCCLFFLKSMYKISERLQEWFVGHHRDLPWRDTKDPYLIWVSEIVLQQTQVAQGTNYYLRFIDRFPDVQSLADAEQMEVLKYWQGLGYYSRARNLHEAAKDVMSRFQGVFPEVYKDILSLKGIGEYTAAAIASFAWNLPYPVLDGNVYRVLGRLFAVSTPIDTGKGKKEYRELAAMIMPPHQAGEHNQAIMEFGALQCVPQHPTCAECPLSDNCMAYNAGNPQLYPVKEKKPKTRDRYLNYFFITFGSHTFLHCRSEKDIWKGLYEFPLIETDKPLNFTEIQNEPAFKKLFHSASTSTFTLEKENVKHTLTHQTLHATFYRVEIQKEPAIIKNYVKLPLSKIEDYPFPKLISAFLQQSLCTSVPPVPLC